MITIQNYVRPRSLEEAWELNQNKRSRILGGMLWLRLGNPGIGTAIDLGGLGLDRIEETETEFSIGAMATLRALEQHPGLSAYTNGAVRDAVKDIVGVQFRNMATVGGSIWGRFGFSDVLTVFLAMDCRVELYKGGQVPLWEFAQQKKDRDILVRLIIKKTPGKMVYQAMRNQRTDFPVLTCAVACMDGEYRAAIGARPGRALLIPDAEGILADGITGERAEAFGAYVAAQVPTESNLRGSARYRSRLARVLTARAVQAMGGI